MTSLRIFDPKFEDLLRTEPKLFENYETCVCRPDESMEEGISQMTMERTILSCSYCRVQFANVEQQRAHYKLDWHRYNLKRHLGGQPILTEEEFQNRNDDVSSISGSESEIEDISDATSVTYLTPNQGRVYVSCNDGSLFLLYRCLLAEKKQEICDLRRSLTKLKNNKLAVLMLGGGHFAGAIFDGPTAFLHNTFHCYTVRAGQGGAQSKRDNRNASSIPKSAGASLRRYNEKALVQHVSAIITTWKEELMKCCVIAFRAPGPYNKAVLFGGKTPVLQRDDERLRVIPFSTRRATFKEVTRVYELLSTIILYDSIESIPSIPPDEKGECRRNNLKVAINRAKSREETERPLPFALSSEDEGDVSFTPLKYPLKPVEKSDEDDIAFQLEKLEISFSEELEPFVDSLNPQERTLKNSGSSRKTQAHLERQAKLKADKHRSKIECQFKHDIQQAILTNNTDKFEKLLKSHPHLINAPLELEKNTALHLCAELHKLEFLSQLLANNADVCVKNNKNQTPYTVTQDKATRAIFRQFAQDNPDKFNYNKAQIPLPDPLSEAQLQEKLVKQQQLKKAKRDKDKEKRKVRAVEAKEQAEQDRFALLSDREKRALAAERRILNQNGVVISRCFLCGYDISGKVPFEYSGYRFCSIDCLKGHRICNPVMLS